MDIKEKAFDKAYANVITLTFKRNRTSHEIESGCSGGIDIDQLIGIKEQTESELEIWSYILSLIEKNDTL